MIQGKNLEIVEFKDTSICNLLFFVCIVYSVQPNNRPNRRETTRPMSFQTAPPSVPAWFRVRFSPSLGIFSLGLNVRDGFVQRYVTQPLLSFLCVVSLAHRELIEKPNGVNDTHLFKENVSGSTANFRYRSCLHVHMSSSITSSVGNTTLVSNPFKVLAFLRNLSSQVQK